MTSRPTPSAFARLLHELSLCQGEELERALAESAPMFARLSARAAPRILGKPHLSPEYFTRERAERELCRLVERELIRLCELAALHDGDEEQMGITQRDLSELISEELDVAKSLGCLRRSTYQEARAQAKLLRLGVCDSAALQTCADKVRSRSTRDALG
ncbi:MAG TPA: hypothetical protein VK843_22220 [Planctomycetota bacterium]|nr:hypothetical protein [Planctomycetota bacterium]